MRCARIPPHTGLIARSADVLGHVPKELWPLTVMYFRLCGLNWWKLSRGDARELARYREIISRYRKDKSHEMASR